MLLDEPAVVLAEPSPIDGDRAALLATMEHGHTARVLGHDAKILAGDRFERQSLACACARARVDVAGLDVPADQAVGTGHSWSNGSVIGRC
jgi:hypothetical protein